MRAQLLALSLLCLSSGACVIITERPVDTVPPPPVAAQTALADSAGSEARAPSTTSRVARVDAGSGEKGQTAALVSSDEAQPLR